MRYGAALLATAFALSALGATVMAKPAKKAATTAPSKKPPAKAAPAPAAVVAAPVVSQGPTAPQAVKLRPTTPEEAEANAIWNIRAGLNIAALQCQFLPFLATVRTYNDVLRQHSEELDRARLTMTAHFKRYDGAAKAQMAFDQYTTRTYNSFSSIDAQLPFCEAAGIIGRQVLASPKGKFGAMALKLNPVFRTALIPGVGLPPIVTTVDMTPRSLSGFDEN